MAAKINWHRYGTKLRHWAAMASQAIYKWQPFSGTLKNRETGAERKSACGIDCFLVRWKS